MRRPLLIFISLGPVVFLGCFLRIMYNNENTIYRKVPSVELKPLSAEGGEEPCCGDEKRVRRYMRVLGYVPVKVWTVLCIMLATPALVYLGVPVDTILKSLKQHTIIYDNSTSE